MRGRPLTPLARRGLAQRWLAGEKGTALAAEYGVSPNRVSQIVKEYLGGASGREARKTRMKELSTQHAVEVQPEARCGRVHTKLRERSTRQTTRPELAWRSEQAKVLGEPARGRSALERKKQQMLEMLVGAS